MKVPTLAYTIGLPIITFLAPVLGIADAASLPRNHRRHAAAGIGAPKFLFPRHVKRFVGSELFSNSSSINPESSNSKHSNLKRDLNIESLAGGAISDKTKKTSNDQFQNYPQNAPPPPSPSGSPTIFPSIVDNRNENTESNVNPNVNLTDTTAPDTPNSPTDTNDPETVNSPLVLTKEPDVTNDNSNSPVVGSATKKVDTGNGGLPGVEAKPIDIKPVKATDPVKGQKKDAPNPMGQNPVDTFPTLDPQHVSDVVNPNDTVKDPKEDASDPDTFQTVDPQHVDNVANPNTVTDPVVNQVAAPVKYPKKDAPNPMGQNPVDTFPTVDPQHVDNVNPNNKVIDPAEKAGNLAHNVTGPVVEKVKNLKEDASNSDTFQTVDPQHVDNVANPNNVTNPVVDNVANPNNVTDPVVDKVTAPVKSPKKDVPNPADQRSDDTLQTVDPQHVDNANPNNVIYPVGKVSNLAHNVTGPLVGNVTVPVNNLKNDVPNPADQRSDDTLQTVDPQHVDNANPNNVIYPVGKVSNLAHNVTGPLVGNVTVPVKDSKTDAPKVENLTTKLPSVVDPVVNVTPNTPETVVNLTKSVDVPPKKVEDLTTKLSPVGDPVVNVTHNTSEAVVDLTNHVDVPPKVDHPTNNINTTSPAVLDLAGNVTDNTSGTVAGLTKVTDGRPVDLPMDGVPPVNGTVNPDGIDTTKDVIKGPNEKVTALPDRIDTGLPSNLTKLPDTTPPVTNATENNPKGIINLTKGVPIASGDNGTQTPALNPALNDAPKDEKPEIFPNPPLLNITDTSPSPVVPPMGLNSTGVSTHPPYPTGASPPHNIDLPYPTGASPSHHVDLPFPTGYIPGLKPDLKGVDAAKPSESYKYSASHSEPTSSHPEPTEFPASQDGNPAKKPDDKVTPPNSQEPTKKPDDKVTPPNSQEPTKSVPHEYPTKKPDDKATPHIQDPPPQLPPPHSPSSTPTPRPASPGVNPSQIWFPTSSLALAPSSSYVPPASEYKHTGTSAPPAATDTVDTDIPPQLPPQLPRVITPVGGMPSAPVDMILIRLGFEHQLNYQFVVNETMAVAQIFEFIPRGLNYGLNIDSAKMHSLQPYDTRASKGFITTLALAFIPKDLFNDLDNQRIAPTSRFLNNPVESVRLMINLLDPTIPLRASSDEESGNGNGQLATQGETWAGKDGVAGGGTTSSDGAPIGNSSGPISTKTVGIGCAAVAGALMYGGAMFFVARRYRQRRNRHSRAASMSRTISPGNSHITGSLSPGTATGGAVMHGARAAFGDNRVSKGSGKQSARGANISAPVMSENSLGWN
jgi:hypothetical protein